MSGLADDPLAEWPDRTPLYGDDGRLLLVFTMSEVTRDGGAWADGAWRPAAAPVAAAGKAVLHAMSGFALSTSDTQLTARLESAGATVIRHAHAMSHALNTLPAVRHAADLAVEPLSARQLKRHAERIAALNLAAYPPGHPDHAHDTQESAIRGMLKVARGEVLGPYLRQSRVALASDEILGVCLVVEREGAPPEGGPWIVDVFRDPAATVRGIGGALIAASLHASASAGLAGLSLAVSHANTRARTLYAKLGFVDASESWTLVIP